MTRLRIIFVLAQAALLASACSSQAPKYVTPSTPIPDAYKELKDWKQAEPLDAGYGTAWWKVFGDPLLTHLEQQVQVSNQTVLQAEAAYRQARSAIDAARSAEFPTVNGTASASRSSNKAGDARTTTNNYSASLIASWEADLWGRVRDSVTASKASAQASAAELAAIRLSMQAALAQNYFQLRTVDAQIKLFAETIAVYEKALQLVRNQYSSGVIAKADVVLAQTTLRSTEAQAVDLKIQRAVLEHSIAVLIGLPPASFSLEAMPAMVPFPKIPSGLPSQLLERRPDIAAAERRVAAANAQIGVARSAYFPTISLGATGGFQDTGLASLLSLPNRFWSVGPALAQSLFDGGLRRAQSAQAIAAYDANVAAYRQTVLSGFQEVEDQLSTLRVLEQEAEIQDDALKLARQSLVLAINQYKAGILNYTNVVTVESTALAEERSNVDILGRRMVASVQLIKALGGGWESRLIEVADK